MLVIFLRALILYLVVFLVIRLMGKKELSKVQPFELTIIIVIADLASAPMSDRGISTFDGIIPIVALFICYMVFTFILQVSPKVEEIVCGKNIILIKDGRIVEEELRKNQYTVSDIMCQLREKDVFKIQDVKYAIIENNGTLNVIKNRDNVNKMPLNIVEDGVVNDNNKELLEMSDNEVSKLLKDNKVVLENILIGTIDEDGKFIYQEKQEKKL